MFSALGNMFKNLSGMQKLMKDENMQKFLSMPEVQELMNDKEFQQAAKDKNHLKLMSNPKLVSLMKNKDVQESLSKIDMKNIKV